MLYKCGHYKQALDYLSKLAIDNPKDPKLLYKVYRAQAKVYSKLLDKDRTLASLMKARKALFCLSNPQVKVSASNVVDSQVRDKLDNSSLAVLLF